MRLNPRLCQSLHRMRVLVLLAALGALFLFARGAAIAQNEREANKEQAPDDQQVHQVQLSTVLPTRLADFVKRYGQDREVSVRPGQMEEELAKAEPQATRVIETIGPRGYFAVPGPVTLRAERIPSRSLTRGVRPVLLVAGTEVVLADSSRVKFGEEISLPRVRCNRGDLCEQTEVQSGLVFNSGTTGLTVEDVTGVATLSPGEAVYVIPREQWDESGEGNGGSGGVASSCSVSCGTGYFACCNNTTFWEGAKCKCLLNSARASCNSGGVGSSSCSIAD